MKIVTLLMLLSTCVGAMALRPAVAEGQKAPEKAVCVVCFVKEDHKTSEPVKASAEYKERTYRFCSEDDKNEFVKNPEKYVAAAK